MFKSFPILWRIILKMLFGIFDWHHQIPIWEMSIGQKLQKITRTISNRKTEKQCAQKAKVFYFLLKFLRSSSVSRRSLREKQRFNLVCPSNKIIYKIRKLNPEKTFSFFKVILGIDKRESIHPGFRDLQLSSKHFESYLSMLSCLSARIKK